MLLTETSVEKFCESFHKLSGFKPFRWQERLYRDYFAKGKIPGALDLPTGLGKTTVMALWYLARQAGAKLPRRLVYVVDRRAVVDQATEEAEKIKEKSGGEGLRISTLRGQYADNREWLEDPAAEAIIVGTVDMIGSRLLFEGYGVSRKMRPYMAGLLGADTLLVLDESHLVPPFEKLLEQIQKGDSLRAKDEADGAVIPPFRLLPLSATGGEREDEVFSLQDEDKGDEPVRRRLDAVKRLRFEPDGDTKLEARLADAAWKLCGEGTSPARILVYCNSRDVAGKVKDTLDKKAKGVKIDIKSELFVGARRVREREKAKDTLDKLGFFSQKDKPPPEHPAFVIATSAGEVGVDLDADHMVMDLVPFERMVQRLGRVNRLGEKESEIVVVHGDKPEPKKKDTPTEAETRALIAWEAGKLLGRLPQHEDGCHEASPSALVKLKEENGDAVKEASTPDPLYPALTRPLVDAWSMTSLAEHTGRPEVQPWLRGWVEEEPKTTVIWRIHLPVRTKGGEVAPEEIDAFFAAAPPHLTEKLETETYQVHDWLKKRLKELQKAADKVQETESGEKSDGGKLLRRKDVAAFVLGRGNEAMRQPLTLAELGEEAARDAKTFKHLYGNKTFVFDARIRGLSEGGLLDDTAPAPVPCADAENGWLTSRKDEPDKKKPLVPFRVQYVRVETDKKGEGSEDESAAEEHEDSSFRDKRWRAIHSFDVERDSEGNALRQLIVEKWREADTTEDSRSISAKKQSLEDHQAWAEEAAETIVARLDLPETIKKAIALAAKLHDEGKRAPIWQSAFSAKTDKIYAKTTGPFRRSLLNGYRHEFGSLLEIETSNSLAAEPERELILHLIAAHHGRARAVIETAGCDQAPPSALEARAREVALRFARLQKRFGPWGLAWLEALLRAADQQASRDLDEERASDG